MDAYESQTLMQLACAARVMNDAPNYIHVDRDGVSICTDTNLISMCPQGNRLYGGKIQGRMSMIYFLHLGIKFYMQTLMPSVSVLGVNPAPENYRIHLTTSPDDSVPTAPSTPISDELLTKLYRGDEI